MYPEEDLLPLSGLAQLVFCERRAALVHIEGLWQDNVATVEGSHLHQQADLPGSESRGDMRIARGLLIRSLRLGVTGKADVVEFHHVLENDSDEEEPLRSSVPLPGCEGLWRPFPVEYKRGRLRREEGYEVQLCAQGICLEEMLGVRVPAGAVYYGKNRRRLPVEFTPALRQETEEAAARLHTLVSQSETPKAVWGAKCKYCSLADMCLPEVLAAGKSALKYLQKALDE